MRAVLTGLLLLALASPLANPLLGNASVARAEEPATVAPNPVAEAAAKPSIASEPDPSLRASARPLSPMHREIREALDLQQTTLSELYAAMKQPVSPDEALRLQRRIEETKRSTQIAILEIQVRHAKAAGHEERASRLEEAVRALTEPALRKAPVPRPAPVGGEGR